MSSGSLLDVMRPGRRFVVVGAGLEASVQDADEPVGQLPQGRAVVEASGALFVVVGTSAGRSVQGRERLRVQRIDEPIVVNEPRRDDLLLAGGT